MLLANEVGDIVAIKSGFTSGYGGVGPACFSAVLQLLAAHGIEIDEWITDATFIERLDNCLLTTSDVDQAVNSKPVRPSRWADYIRKEERSKETNGQLLAEFPSIMPYSIIDHRVIDLARTFWDDPDGKLNAGYRRLEDIVRARTGISEHGTKLFSSAFLDEKSILTWNVSDTGEKKGRAQLFIAVFMAYRNPRAHREGLTSETLAEFLLLNQLYRLEGEAQIA